MYLQICSFGLFYYEALQINDERRGNMETEILQMATSQGVWAVLFVALLFFVLKENSKREEKFQDIITSLTENLDTLDTIKSDLLEIKTALQSLKK